MSQQVGEEKTTKLAIKVFNLQSEWSSDFTLDQFEMNPAENPTLNLQRPVSTSFFVSADDFEGQDFYLPVYNKVNWIGETPAEYKITFLDLSEAKKLDHQILCSSNTEKILHFSATTLQQKNSSAKVSLGIATITDGTNLRFAMFNLSRNILES